MLTKHRLLTRSMPRVKANKADRPEHLVADLVTVWKTHRIAWHCSNTRATGKKSKTGNVKSPSFYFLCPAIITYLQISPRFIRFSFLIPEEAECLYFRQSELRDLEGTTKAYGLFTSNSTFDAVATEIIWIPYLQPINITQYVQPHTHCSVRYINYFRR